MSALGHLDLPCTGNGTQTEANQSGQHDYMLVDFALGLFHSGLKKGNLGGQSPAALALLDPMLPLLIRALRSRHANSVSLALKCLSFLVRLPLPGEPKSTTSVFLCCGSNVIWFGFFIPLAVAQNAGHATCCFDVTERHSVS